MKIAFSARGLGTSHGGVRQYIRGIIPALARQIKDDELFVFYNNDKFLGLAQGCTEIVIKGNNKLLWDFVLFPRMLRKIKFDAAIFSIDVMPFFAGCPGYIIHYDLAYFNKVLKPYRFWDTLYMKTMIPISDRKAKAIFAISEHTKKDCVKFCNTNPEKITVIYAAANEEFKPIKDAAILEKVRYKFNLPKKFIFYAGSLSPRKNMITLIRAFSQIISKIPHKLVLTVPESWKDSMVYKTINELNIRDSLVNLGFIDQEDMPALYNLADICVYPSLYEGFGLPVLEAMHCGCPVVASNASSIPEVAGNAAVLIDPLDTNAVAEAVYQVLIDRQFREKLIWLGFRQAEKFSWDRTAGIVLNVIREKHCNP
jgi:glycosyltransferase involved in cell wall biosynthesis